MPTNNWLLACYICLLLVLGFTAISDQMLHWFIVPVLFCGCITGVDAIDWLRGKVDTFDIVGILGLYGWYFFFLAPLLHIYWACWTIDTDTTWPTDWRPWLGWMAALNALGLIVYRASYKAMAKPMQKSATKLWKLNLTSYWRFIFIAMLITVLVQIQVYKDSGGIQAYIANATYLRMLGDRGQGMGWIFMISESFPVLAIFAYAVYARSHNRGRSWAIIIFVIIVFFGLRILFGGLRGSRSNTVWALFWAMGVIHFWVRPVPRKLIFIGTCYLIVFMYFYGFFKGVGLDAVQALSSSESRVALEESTGRNLKNTLLGDLGRSDIQSFLLYRITSPTSDYTYAMGRTYLSAVSILIPRSMMERQPGKEKEGTDAQYGMGSYIPIRQQSSKVYGLAGEAMLNFGPVGVPFAFLMWGFLVRYIRGFVASLDPSDPRLLIAPLLINLGIIVLTSDLDNDIFDLIKNGFLPVLVLAMTTLLPYRNWSHARQG